MLKSVYEFGKVIIVEVDKNDSGALRFYSQSKLEMIATDQVMHENEVTDIKLHLGKFIDKIKV